MSNDLQNTQTGMTVEKVRGSLDSTDNGAIKNSIRNCLTVFQNDPKMEGANLYNILTERIDIVKPLRWSKPTTNLERYGFELPGALSGRPVHAHQRKENPESNLHCR